ncbi:hypothetical protein HK100_001740 [Physocladia obscura]|uniref:Uncharacterized protein n=1 Tax=Physocladia obscura TaxID=109957 RepID=A0AAD5SWE5_9FUNG|nr:hypothetical protein HK100_001740 [Physocladia obscura]
MLCIIGGTHAFPYGMGSNKVFRNAKRGIDYVHVPYLTGISSVTLPPPAFASETEITPASTQTYIAPPENQSVTELTLSSQPPVDTATQPPISPPEQPVLSSQSTCPIYKTPCQIQSDPTITPFTGTGAYTISTIDPGTYAAVTSPSFTVSLLFTSVYSANRVQEVLVVDSVTYLCGDNAAVTVSVSAGFTGTSAYTCVSGDCAGSGALCSLVLVRGEDPVPNVQVQQIYYMGGDATGGLCYGQTGIC